MDMNMIALIKGLAGNGGGGSSGGGVMYVTNNQDTMTLDKNLEEIQTALDGGKVVMLKIESQSNGVIYFPLSRAASYPEDPYYGVSFFNFAVKQEMTFSNATSPTDPLVYEE